MENYKLKRNIKHFKSIYIYIKKEKPITKSGDFEIKKQKFHQHKRSISIKIYRY